MVPEQFVVVDVVCCAGVEQVAVSHDQGRRLLGEDEAGLSDAGVSNFEAMVLADSA